MTKTIFAAILVCAMVMVHGAQATSQKKDHGRPNVSNSRTIPVDQVRVQPGPCIDDWECRI